MNVTQSSQPASKQAAGGQSARVGRSEARYLLPILVPPLLVCLLLAYGKYQEVAAARDVQNELDRLGESNVMQNFRMTTASFDRRLDDTHSKAWLDVLQATEWLYGVSYDVDAPEWHIEMPMNGENGEVRRRWNEALAPILAKVHKLVDAAGPDSDPVWIPQVFSETTLIPVLTSSSTIIKLLETEFRSAAAERDASQALRSLQAINGVIRAFDWQVGIGSEMNHQSNRHRLRVLINDSLSMNLWETDEQLIQLRALLLDRHSVEGRWRAMWEQHYVYTLAKWESEGRHMVVLHARQPVMSAAKKAILESMRTISQSSVSNESGVTCRVGTVAFAKVFGRRLYGEIEHPAHTTITPSIVSLPYANQTTDLLGLDYATKLAISLALDQIERKWTLTAIAVKQFKIKEGRWPNNLQVLESVGHTSADSIVDDGLPFEIRQVDDGAMVGVAKILSKFPFLASHMQEYKNKTVR